MAERAEAEGGCLPRRDGRDQDQQETCQEVLHGPAIQIAEKERPRTLGPRKRSDYGKTSGAAQ